MAEKNSEGTDDGIYRSRVLWVMTELYFPEETSTGFYMTRIAEGLAPDLDVKVICGQPNYSARGERAPARETKNGVNIFRVWGTTFNKNIIFLRLLNMLTLGLSMFWKAIRCFRSGDRVLVVTTPPSLPFLTAVAALIRGAGYTLLIHDKYPELAFAAEKLREGTHFAGILEFLNRWLYKSATRIIVVGRDMELLIKRKTEGLDIPVAYIPNWAELDQVEPAIRSENALLTELGLHEKFVFLYAGNMGYPNELSDFIWCAERLLENEDHFHFIFLGSGARRDWLENICAEKGLSNVSILEPRPRAEQKDFLNACDVALISLVKKMWGVSMPSRTYNILAAGKPILALTEAGSELDLVISEEAVGWSNPPGQTEKLLELIREIYQDRDKLFEMGLNARSSALNKYSLESAVEKYKSVLSDARPITNQNKEARQ